MASTQLYHDASAGNQKTWTFSAWVKRGGLGAVSYLYSQGSAGNNYIGIYFGSADDFRVYNEVSSNQTLYFRTNRLFRDTAFWYHVVVKCDTTQYTEADRFKIYINGVQETSFSSASYPAQNSDTNMNATTRERIGVLHPGSNSPNYYWNGSMSHVHLTDGNAYDASAFGSTDSTTGEWKINTSPSVTYGTNGFFILKDGNSGTDQSGQSNNFSTSGSLTKTEDCPDNVFATLNTLYNSGGTVTYTNGNNTFNEGDNQWKTTFSTLGASSGKYYAEFKCSGNYAMIGVADYNVTKSGIADRNFCSTTYISEQGYGIYNGNGDLYYRGSSTSYADTYGSGDIIGVALDCDNNRVFFS